MEITRINIALSSFGLRSGMSWATHFLSYFSATSFVNTTEILLQKNIQIHFNYRQKINILSKKN